MNLHCTLRRTALVFLANMNSLNDPTNWLHGRTSNATHSFLPASFDGPQKVNNAMAMEMISTFIPGLRDLQVELVDENSMVIDEKQRMIWIHAKSKGMSDVGFYSNEYIFKLVTTDDGKSVKESWEFLDSWRTKEILARYNQTADGAKV